MKIYASMMKPTDPIDLKILKLLKNDSRLSNREIGELVHRTGQAVGSRITKMQEEGIIERYTIAIQHTSTQFIRMMMQNNQFNELETFVSQFDAVESCYKVCGSACYMVVSHFEQNELNAFIEQLSKWGQYSVDSVMRSVKAPRSTQ